MRYFLVCFLGVFLLFVSDKMIFAQSTQERLKQMRSTVIEKIDGRDFYIHTIKRGQTLYMISKAYHVDVNDIIQENPGVKEGIKADKKLRIPVPGQKIPNTPKTADGKDKSVTEKENKTTKKEIPEKADSVVKVELPCGIDSATKKPMYNVALMLPLYLAGVDQIDMENPDPKIAESSKSFQFLPYYEGFRIALDSLEKTGLRIMLYVYDVDKDTAKTRLLLKKPEMKTMDLIFGLLYHQNFQIVAAFAKKNRINLVNPISERSELIAGNPFVFKVQPPKKIQLGQLAAYLVETFKNGQVLIVRNGKYSDHDAPDQLKKECQEHSLKAQVVEGQEAAISRFSKDMPVCVVAFSDDQAYTLDLMKGLYKLRNDYDLTLIGLPNWSAMEGLENEYLVALKTHFLSRSFIDYDNQTVKQFVRKYQETYYADPELLAFQGFDQSFYFLSALKSFGANISRCVGEYKMNLLEARFDFIQTKDNGFENRRWMMYKFENYRLVAIH